MSNTLIYKDFEINIKQLGLSWVASVAFNRFVWHSKPCLIKEDAIALAKQEINNYIR